MPQYLDRCIFFSQAGGLADFQLAGEAVGYRNPAQAGAVDGSIYHYAAEQRDSAGNIIAWEYGDGVWTAASSTLTRASVRASSTGAKVNFAAAPRIMITAIAGDFGVYAAYTPVLSFGSGGTVGITYNNQVGRWMRIGNFVFGAAHIELTNKGSSVGTANISIPVTSGGAGGIDQGGALITSFNSFTGLTGNMYGFIGTSFNTLALRTQSTGGNVDVVDSNFTNTSQVFANFFYMANPVLA